MENEHPNWREELERKHAHEGRKRIGKAGMFLKKINEQKASSQANSEELAVSKSTGDLDKSSMLSARRVLHKAASAISIKERSQEVVTTSPHATVSSTTCATNTTSSASSPAKKPVAASQGASAKSPEALTAASKSAFKAQEKTASAFSVASSVASSVDTSVDADIDDNAPLDIDDLLPLGRASNIKAPLSEPSTSDYFMASSQPAKTQHSNPFSHSQASASQAQTAYHPQGNQPRGNASIFTPQQALQAEVAGYYGPSSSAPFNMASQATPSVNQGWGNQTSTQHGANQAAQVVNNGVVEKELAKAKKRKELAHSIQPSNSANAFGSRAVNEFELGQKYFQQRYPSSFNAQLQQRSSAMSGSQIANLFMSAPAQAPATQWNQGVSQFGSPQAQGAMGANQNIGEAHNMSKMSQAGGLGIGYGQVQGDSQRAGGTGANFGVGSLINLNQNQQQVEALEKSLAELYGNGPTQNEGQANMSSPDLNAESAERVFIDLEKPADRSNIQHMVNQVLGHNGLMSSTVENFKERPGQVEMATSFGLGLFDQNYTLQLIEAGTGLGKTYAYLMPLLLTRQNALISTETKLLQDQIVSKDLPFLIELLKLENEVSYASLKGVANYLCHFKIDALKPSVYQEYLRSFYSKKLKSAEDSSDDDRAAFFEERLEQAKNEAWDQYTHFLGKGFGSLDQESRSAVLYEMIRIGKYFFDDPRVIEYDSKFLPPNFWEADFAFNQLLNENSALRQVVHPRPSVLKLLKTYSSELKQMFACDLSECIKCPFRDPANTTYVCAYHQAYNKACKSKIAVINHSLLVSKVLPHQTVKSMMSEFVVGAPLSTANYEVVVQDNADLTAELGQYGLSDEQGQNVKSQQGQVVNSPWGTHDMPDGTFSSERGMLNLDDEHLIQCFGEWRDDQEEMNSFLQPNLGAKDSQHRQSQAQGAHSGCAEQVEQAGQGEQERDDEANELNIDRLLDGRQSVVCDEAHAVEEVLKGSYSEGLSKSKLILMAKAISSSRFKFTDEELKERLLQNIALFINSFSQVPAGEYDFREFKYLTAQNTSWLQGFYLAKHGSAYYMQDKPKLLPGSKKRHELRYDQYGNKVLNQEFCEFILQLAEDLNSLSIECASRGTRNNDYRYLRLARDLQDTAYIIKSLKGHDDGDNLVRYVAILHMGIEEDPEDQEGIPMGYQDTLGLDLGVSIGNQYEGLNFSITIHPFSVELISRTFFGLLQRLKCVPMLTSATLQMWSDGAFNFEHLHRHLGFNQLPHSHRVFDSPFNYQQNTLVWRSPLFRRSQDKGQPSPENIKFNLYLMLPIINEIRGGILILVTSYKMLAVYQEMLQQMLRAHGMFERVLFCQQKGKSLNALVSEYRACLKNGGFPILIGTKSCWTGLDLVGKDVQMLVIDKLPFAPPSLESEILGDICKDSFNEFSLPKTLLELKQGVGRLIRSESDWGVVVLNDDSYKPYNSGVIASLGKMPIRYDKDAQGIVQFVREHNEKKRL